ncbi:MAG: GHKL domain-containing protein [Lachnospiraceae bacterium]|nr:GHKL domain-containing protein [Lachnospiraceae bacterium]
MRFVPFLLCIYYLSFCVIYYRQYEEKQEIATRNMLMELRQEQSEQEVKTLQHSEKAVTLLRHDMLHFLNNISLFIENGKNAEAQEYIQNIIQTTRSTSGKRYCANQMVNMILASYGEIFAKNEIDFSYTVAIPEELFISDVDITSILSNALENALHAVLPLDSTLRIIELHMMQREGKLLICLSNSYARKPQMSDGCPVTEQKGHGFGTQSIRYTVERLHGNCLFSVNDQRFVLQIVV